MTVNPPHTRPTDPLAAMRNAMENALEYRALAVGDDNNRYYRSMADREQRRAIMLAAVAQAESLAHIATHLGNIHQVLITPNADGEPMTVADLAKHITDHLERRTMPTK